MACCIKYYTGDLPPAGANKSLYINQITGEQWIWDGSSFIRSGKAYKSYVALLSQLGTAAPTAIVLEDSIGISASDFSRIGIGHYRITNSKLIDDKTMAFTQSLAHVEESVFVCARANIVPNTVEITSGDHEGIIFYDDTLIKDFIEIRVYY